MTSHISPEENDVLQGTSNESVASHTSPEEEYDLQGTLNKEGKLICTFRCKP